MNKQRKTLLERWKEADSKGKKIILAEHFALSLGIFIFIAFVVGYGMKIITRIEDKNYLEIGLTNGLKITFILFLLTVLLYIISILIERKEIKNRIATTDDKGVAYAEKGTMGSSHFANDIPAEIPVMYRLENIKEYDEFVFGQDTTLGEICYFFKELENRPTGTRHILIVAKSGAGKSANIVIPNIINAIKRGHSVVVVDPSGELYIKLGQYARDKGYDVKLLNLDNLEYSEYWNCLAQECIDEETGRCEPQRISEFTSIYLTNSKFVEKQDFWLECAQGLIETTIGYLGVRREMFILENYIKLYEKMTGEIGSQFAKSCRETFVSFKWAEEYLRDIAEKSGYDLSTVENFIKEAKKNAPKFTIDELYHALHDIKNVEKEFVSLPRFHPSYEAYKRYKINEKDAVIDGAKQGAMRKFAIFDDYKLRAVLSNDGINFKTVNMKKSIYFLCMPDTSSYLQPIASLFFSFFFKDAQQNYDREKQLAIKEKRPQRTIPTMVMMDEFASLGVISGDPKDFEKIMSDCRKRDLYNIVVLQHINQLYANYGIYEDGIKSACQTTVCLGVSTNDIKTQEFISKLGGTTTVISNSYRVNENILHTTESNQVNLSETRRPLILPEESVKIGTEDFNNKIVVFRDGCSPLKMNTLFYKEMPEYINGEMRDVSYLENIQPLTERENERKANEKEDGEYFINGLLAGIKSVIQEPKKKRISFDTLSSSSDDNSSLSAYD